MAKRSAEGTAATGEPSAGFTAEERAAMRERAKEVKAAARRDAQANREEEEAQAVVAKLAELAEPDRGLGERLHAIITASAPALAPKLWYGMPAYARGARSSASSSPRRSSARATRRSASTTRRTSTRAPCGRPRSR